MAHFYGKVMGQAVGHATRLGTKKSGLTTLAASHSGAVQVDLYEHHGDDWARIALTPHQGKGTYRILWEGPVSGEGVVS